MNVHLIRCESCRRMIDRTAINLVNAQGVNFLVCEDCQ